MHQFVKYILLLFAALLILVSCKEKTGNKIKIGFSQAMATDDWRKQMNSSLKVAASLQPDVDLTIADADNNVEKQIKDIERFIANKADVIIVSPIHSKPLTAVVGKSIKAGIPVLIVDRKIEGENYTAYLGADNIEIGRIAAHYIISQNKGPAKIIEIAGASASSPAYERGLGFNQIIGKNSNFQIISTIQGDWEKESVKKPLKKILLENPDVDYIFAHNDRMALSAWETAKTLDLEKKIKFIGVDGLNNVNGGIELVKNGVLDCTILYPTGGNEALKLALQISRNESVAKNNILSTIVIDKNNAEIIQNQMNKVDEQQMIIESQLKAIKDQEKKYASQNNLLLLLSIFLIIILTLTIYSIYSTISISRQKRQLEEINQTVIDQKNEIQEMAKTAAKDNDAKLNFFTGLPHEFKTPVTSIMCYAESLIENEKFRGSTAIDEIKLIHKNSNQLLRLINQLLDFRKIEENKLALRTSNTKIYDFTAETMTNFKGEAARRNIDFQLSCKNKNLELFIDWGLMDKIYFNLLSNAFKLTPNNGKISITITENLDNEVEIHIKDSGIGIPYNDLSAVFDRFLNASNSNKYGPGIGLYLLKEFVLFHRGRIEVRSKQGNEFVVALLKGTSHLQPSEIITPRKKPTDSADLIKDDLKNGSGLEIVKPICDEKQTILVIQDNADLAGFLKAKLSNEYTVYISDGSDSTEKTLELVPDIIICDSDLADQNACKISQEIKNDLRYSHIPIIILANQNNKESILKGLQSGVDQFLAKPFSLSILKQSISSLLLNREKLRYYYTNNIYRIEPKFKFGNHEQSFITKMNEIIKANIENPKFSVEDLADKVGVSRVQLYRKVKAIIGINISDHINNFKLEKAAELLKSKELNISEIAHSLGFSSSSYFSTAFKNKFGVSPKDYKTSN